VQTLIYLLWRPERTATDAYADRLLDVCAPQLLARGARGLTLHVADSDAAVAPPSRGLTCRPPPAAQLSLWLASDDARAAYEALLASHARRHVGYLVEESIYRDYGDNRHARRRDWPDGERSPGVTMVSLLERPARLSSEAWLAHWHEVIAPLSEQLTPRTRYVRNRVLAPLSAGAPAYAGLVEESVPSPRHVRDPYLFYSAANLDDLAQRMGQLLGAVMQFLDLPRIQSMMFSEYMLKTPAP
jgi:hypothetical protein